MIAGIFKLLGNVAGSILIFLVVCFIIGVIGLGIEALVK